MRAHTSSRATPAHRKYSMILAHSHMWLSFTANTRVGRRTGLMMICRCIWLNCRHVLFIAFTFSELVLKALTLQHMSHGWSVWQHTGKAPGLPPRCPTTSQALLGRTLSFGFSFQRNHQNMHASHSSLNSVSLLFKMSRLYLKLFQDQYDRSSWVTGRDSFC